MSWSERIHIVSVRSTTNDWQMLAAFTERHLADEFVRAQHCVWIRRLDVLTRSPFGRWYPGEADVVYSKRFYAMIKLEFVVSDVPWQPPVSAWIDHPSSSDRCPVLSEAPPCE